MLHRRAKKIASVAFILLTIGLLLFSKGAVLFFGTVPNANNVDGQAVQVSSNPQTVVYLGGIPVGLSIKSDGVLVADLIEINTDFGRVNPKSTIEINDIILEINGKKTTTTDDINSILKDYTHSCKKLDVLVLREGKEKRATVYPVLEQYSGQFRLGIITRDFAEGIGTITYIKPCGEFGALGHPINSAGGSRLIPVLSGSAFECRIVGYNKGTRGNPGELRGVFANQSKPTGSLHTNSRFGVFGRLNKVPEGELIPVAKRNEVKTGKAEIVSTVGDTQERYSIQIIRATNQNTPLERGMIFRVTDKRLLNSTGGIVQGMSGSPIIQNGKLIGAVTHVFLNDPSKGYGVYMCWMLS